MTLKQESNWSMQLKFGIRKGHEKDDFGAFYSKQNWSTKLNWVPLPSNRARSLSNYNSRDRILYDC